MFILSYTCNYDYELKNRSSIPHKKPDHSFYDNRKYFGFYASSFQNVKKRKCNAKS